eukprot:gnl/Spiro4/38_TR24_c0_g1_i1.p1 gnl/Spiro4/38_TR24_c0_g1~~gnl/Spiro4/38_TR24_c0_g1_i1.p1  ORF type:complete len:286 (+),score=40.38 gnl/Spiro4/38_TR24_c0_g1_i1:90-947(+)
MGSSGGKSKKANPFEKLDESLVLKVLICITNAEDMVAVAGVCSLWRRLVYRSNWKPWSGLDFSFNCHGVKDDRVLSLPPSVCARVKAISLSSCSALTDAAVLFLLRSCPCLVSLSLRHLEIKDSLWNELSSAGGLRLRALDIGFVPRVDDAVLAKLAACRNLRFLNLGYCHEYSDRGLLLLVSQCTLLESLDLTHSALTDIGLEAIAANCSSLRSLGLCYCAGISDRGISAICGRCVWLQQLDLRFTGLGITEACVPLVRSLPKMTAFQCMSPEYLSYHQEIENQ